MDGDNRKTKVQLINELDAARRRLHELGKFSIVEKSNDGIVIIRDGLIEFSNAVASEKYGFSKQDTYGKPFINFIAPQYREQVANIYRKRLIGENAPGTYETIIINKHGSKTPVEICASMVEYEGAAATLAIIRNISERKQTEDLLRESEEKFKTLADKSPNMVFINQTGTIVYANQKCKEITGYDLRELYNPGFNFMSLIEPEHIGRIKTNFASHAAGKDVPPMECTLITKQGRRIEVILSTKLIDYEGSKAILVVVTDITEQKQTEQALMFQANLLDASNDTIIVHDLDGKIAYVNNAACVGFGYTREELLSMNLRQLTGDSETKRLLISRLREVEEKSTATFEVTNRRKDGSEFWREIHDSLLVVDGKKMIVGIGHDITERKQMQAQLIMQDRLASIGQFVSGIAHELNNPLTSVIGFSELVLQKELPEDVRADLNIVNHEAKRTSTIVKNLLTFARQSPQQKQPIFINEPIAAVLQLRSHEQTVNNLTVNANLAKGLPLIQGNESQLQQVFFNLLNNAEFAAIEAHRNGLIIIVTEQMGDFVRVSVADDGPGISPENMNRIFNPFFTTKQPGKGTGLGLSICQGIITEHGGRIWAESESGKGTTFFVELPVHK